MLFSIIIPVYNVEQFLPKCLDSVLEQSYRDLEIIVVNDGSTDGSGPICDEYAKRDNRFRVIHQRNKGIGCARNAGLDLVKGEYICFIDSDDWVEKDYISDFVEQANKSRIVCCGYNVVKGNISRSIHSHVSNILLTNDFVAKFFDDCLNSICSKSYELVGNYLWNKLWPRESFDAIRFPEGQNYEDIYVFLDLLNTVGEVELIPVSNYNYRLRGNSIVNTASKENMVDAVKSRIKQERSLLPYSHLNYKAKILTLCSVCVLFAASYKGDYALTHEEDVYYKKLIEERILFLPKFKYKILYLKSILIMNTDSILKFLYKIKQII